MASSSCDIDYQSIGRQCLDICQASVTSGLVVKMSLSIGTSFRFNFCSESLPAFVDKPKKAKSPATRRRDQARFTAFRNRKAVSPGLPAAPDPSPLDLPEGHSSYKDFKEEFLMRLTTMTLNRLIEEWVAPQCQYFQLLSNF